MAEEAAERAEKAAEDAKPSGTNWLLIIGAAVAAFAAGAGLIWAYDDDVRRGERKRPLEK